MHYVDCNPCQSVPPLPLFVILCVQYMWCQIKAEPFIICWHALLIYLHITVWMDRVWANWLQFPASKAQRQGARLPSWCLIQGSRWRCNSLALRPPTHTLTRHGCCLRWPRGMRGSEWPFLLPKVIVIPGQSCHCVATLNLTDRNFEGCLNSSEHKKCAFNLKKILAVRKTRARRC